MNKSTEVKLFKFRIIVDYVPTLSPPVGTLHFRSGSTATSFLLNLMTTRSALCTSTALILSTKMELRINDICAN